MTVTALIVAAGKGERLGGGVPKQFRTIGGKPVLRWAVESLSRHPAVRATRVVVGQDQQADAGAALRGLDVGGLIEGGAERADSVRAGLAAIDGDAVLVHDAARPFCPPSSSGCSLSSNSSPAPRRCCRLAIRSRASAKPCSSRWIAPGWRGSRLH